MVTTSWTNKEDRSVVLDIMPPAPEKNWSDYCAVIVSNKVVAVTAKSNSPEVAVPELMRRFGKPDGSSDGIIAWTNSHQRLLVLSTKTEAVLSCIADIPNGASLVTFTGMTAASLVQREEALAKLDALSKETDRRTADLDADLKEMDLELVRLKSEREKQEAEYRERLDVFSVKQGDPHIWVFKQGARTTGSWVAATAQTLTIRGQDNQVYRIQISDLCESDQRLVAECLK